MPGSTRTIAFSPPSVTHAAPSGPTITPCGAEPSPSGISVVCPVFGSSRPSLPVCWAVYQTVPSGATATSCGCVPAGTEYSCTRNALAAVAPATRETASAATSAPTSVRDDSIQLLLRRRPDYRSRAVVRPSARRQKPSSLASTSSSPIVPLAPSRSAPRSTTGEPVARVRPDVSQRRLSRGRVYPFEGAAVQAVRKALSGLRNGFVSTGSAARERSVRRVKLP